MTDRAGEYIGARCVRYEPRNANLGFTGRGSAVLRVQYAQVQVGSILKRRMPLCVRVRVYLLDP